MTHLARAPAAGAGQRDTAQQRANLEGSGTRSADRGLRLTVKEFDRGDCGQPDEDARRRSGNISDVLVLECKPVVTWTMDSS
jgi:hypothetical protein